MLSSKRLGSFLVLGTHTNEIPFSGFVLQDDVVAPELPQTTTPTTTSAQGTAAASKASSSAMTTTTVAPLSVATENNQAAATTVKPLKDSSLATGAAESELGLDIEDAGWGSFTTLLFLVVLAGGAVAFWRFGGIQYIRLCCSGNERARYRRVNSDDVEK